MGFDPVGKTLAALTAVVVQTAAVPAAGWRAPYPNEAPHYFEFVRKDEGIRGIASVRSPAKLDAVFVTAASLNYGEAGVVFAGTVTTLRYKGYDTTGISLAISTGFRGNEFQKCFREAIAEMAILFDTRAFAVELCFDPAEWRDIRLPLLGGRMDIQAGPSPLKLSFSVKAGELVTTVAK